MLEIERVRNEETSFQRCQRLVRQNQGGVKVGKSWEEWVRIPLPIYRDTDFELVTNLKEISEG